MKIIKVPIEKCELWDKNPRGITKKDFERLKKQIQKLGIYKPLIACEENGKYIILGGNMRLRALQELGYKEVELSIVEAKTEKEKIEYSLSDNDRVGYYEEEKLAELVYPYLKEIDLEEFKIDLEDSISLRQICEFSGPKILEDGSLDKSNPDHQYSGNSLPFRLGKILAFITDESLEEKIFALEKELLDGGIDQQRINARMTEILKKAL